MFKRNLMTLAVGAIWATSAMTAYAAPSSAGDVARDATAGLRGQLTATDTALDQMLARSKPRVPGGSGCDDPRDLIEHPECVIGYVVPGNELLAREASEGPRGADNERPGDRQRRGGRGHG